MSVKEESKVELDKILDEAEKEVDAALQEMKIV